MKDWAWASMWAVFFLSISTCSYFEHREHGETERAYIAHGYCKSYGWGVKWEKCKP